MKLPVEEAGCDSEPRLDCLACTPEPSILSRNTQIMEVASLSWSLACLARLRQISMLFHTFCEYGLLIQSNRFVVVTFGHGDALIFFDLIGTPFSFTAL